MRALRNPWFWLFVITASFQVFRGSLGDTIIFGLGAILIAVAASTKFNENLIDRKKVRLLVSLPAALTIATYLALLPRHSLPHRLALLAILPLALALVWHRDSGEKSKPQPSMTLARKIWAAIGVGLCLWELAANIFGQLNTTLYQFPTISVLVDPFMDSLAGQAAFVIVWVAAGFGLLRLGARR